MHEDAGPSAEQADAVNKQSIRYFTFSAEDCNNELSVCVTEVLHPDYGMYTWPSAVVLAQYIWHHRDVFRGKQVLELAAGTALPSFVAAKVGAKVTLTDSADFPRCLENCREGCRKNGLRDEDVNVMSLTWGTFEPGLLDLDSLDYLLASDCFYDPNDFEDIIVTIAFILDQHVGCKCLCTYQIRSSNWSIADLLDEWGLQCKPIPLASFHADGPSLAKSNLPGRHTIQMMEFTKRQ